MKEFLATVIVTLLMLATALALVTVGALFGLSTLRAGVDRINHWHLRRRFTPRMPARPHAAFWEWLAAALYVTIIGGGLCWALVAGIRHWAPAPTSLRQARPGRAERPGEVHAAVEPLRGPLGTEVRP
jgi:hypothetical protein